jgi:putative spermidine/putrescine transport system permease protein
MTIRQLFPPNIWLIGPAGLLFIFAFAIPVGEVAVWSFYDDGGAITGEHYRLALGSGPYRTILWGTIQLSIGVAFSCVAIGYPVAYFLASRPRSQQTILLLLILTPLWVSVLVRTYGWIVVLGREGLLNTTIMALGFSREPVQFLYTRGAVYIAMVQVLLPIAVITMFSTMVTINRSLLLAARTLGATPRRAFLEVFLPLSAGGAVSAWLLTFVLALGFFITPALVGGPRDAMIANVIATQISETLNWGLGSALGIVLLVCGFGIMAIVAVLFRRYTKLSGEGGTR